MAKPLVAVVGRPNVGKSTFFNKIAGRRISIVEDTPGVTRDRIYADCEWLNYKFTLIDTGGIDRSDQGGLGRSRQTACAEPEHTEFCKQLVRDWLGDPRYALGSVIAVVCWQNIPFYMVLFLAGLASFPAEIAEAAHLDGASETTIFWRLKLPHLRGTFRTAILLAVIGSLRYFDLIYVMTGGGPEGSSELMATYMYRNVFSSFQLGYGSTVASAMFLIVTAIAAVLLRLSKRFETEV